MENADASDTANPSLWETMRNNHAYGLFKVVDGIYQVRGYDMANLTLVKGKTGWIVFDTLMTTECSKAAFALAEKHLGKRPVKAIIISHSHIDHYGGQYQWVAQITNVLVFADPGNTQARLLCADALEQLAYTAESGTWRNCYLTGAFELRNGTGAAQKLAQRRRSTDTSRNLTPTMLWDYRDIVLDKQAMDKEDLKVNVKLTDTGQTFLLRFKNGPLLHFENLQDRKPDVTLVGPRAGMFALLGGDLKQLKKHVKVSGSEKTLQKIMGNKQGVRRRRCAVPWAERNRYGEEHVGRALQLVERQHRAHRKAAGKRLQGRCGAHRHRHALPRRLPNHRRPGQARSGCRLSARHPRPGREPRRLRRNRRRHSHLLVHDGTGRQHLLLADRSGRQDRRAVHDQRRLAGHRHQRYGARRLKRRRRHRVQHGDSIRQHRRRPAADQAVAGGRLDRPGEETAGVICGRKSSGRFASGQRNLTRKSASRNGVRESAHQRTCDETCCPPVLQGASTSSQQTGGQDKGSQHTLVALAGRRRDIAVHIGNFGRLQIPVQQPRHLAAH